MPNRIVYPDTEGFTMRLRQCGVGELCVHQVWVTGSVSLDTDPFPRGVLGFLRAGRWSGATRREELRGRAGLTYALPPQDAGVYTLQESDCYLLMLPAGTVRRVAFEQYGQDQVHFAGMAPSNTAMQDHWWATGEFARQQLCAPHSPLREPLVHTQLVTLLATIALATFPNTTMTLDYLPGPGSVGPAALRRAVAFIDAHADQPLTLSAIAAAARVSPRGLRDAFRRHRGTTPMGYLRQARLHHAHQDLLTADPTRGDTIAAIAHRWGFTTPAQFAARYHATYGHPPHTDLAQPSPSTARGPSWA
ncbi:AraC-like DNA-binding protein [Kutzneria viridogrisea]|uniref:AraC-like DNA-binding protein n=1 Tax=Kutzneria viridogrisea TaxID=47990 RepID=A0ABR6BBI3_9PSEU|nr:AraC-like DNA-binding protein [Kutzneria viridogrisea]